MPKKLDRCVKRVKKEGKSEDSAWAICQSAVMGKGRGKRKKVVNGVSRRKKR